MRRQALVRSPLHRLQRAEEGTHTVMITDVELDVFVEFCQSIGHLKNNSERKESSHVETAG